MTKNRFRIIIFLSLIICNLSMNKLGISFSAAGLLTPYHLGVSAELKALNILKSNVAISGSSGGALAACTSSLDLPHKDTLNACVQIAKYCRDRGSYASLKPALDEVLGNILPDNAHALINQRVGMTRIAYTQIFPRMSPQTISQYKSRDDLIEVLLASCTIPFYFSGYPATQLQRDLSYAVDGVFSFEIDRFGCPPTGASSLEILVYPFRLKEFGLNPKKLSSPSSSCEIDIISPELLSREDWSFDRLDLLRLALFPPHSKSLSKLSKAVADHNYSNEFDSSVDKNIENVYNFLFEAGSKSVKAWMKISSKNYELARSLQEQV